MARSHRLFSLSLARFESQSIISAFNPQASGTAQQDSPLTNLNQPPMISWLSSAMAAQQQQQQQQTVNQGTPYGSASNQYMMNSNPDSYLQSMANYHQSSAAHPSFPTQYWSAVPTALMFPAPPQAMLPQQQQALSNEQQSPQSKNNRPMTPVNSSDLLSTSQPNQQAAQYMNMSRGAQNSGRAISRRRGVNESLSLFSELPVLRRRITDVS